MRAEKNPIRPLLVIGAVAIWGAVFLRFSGYLDSGEALVAPETSASVDSVSLEPSRSEVEFRGDYRDPFRPDGPRKQVASAEQSDVTPLPESSAPEWPVLNLNGIIGTTALIFDQSNGGLRYVEPGEEFGGITLSAIRGDSVRLSLGSEQRYLKLRQ